MKLTPIASLFLALIAGVTLTACARSKALPNLPSTHPEQLANGPVSCSECHDNEHTGTMRTDAVFSHSRTFVTKHRFYIGSDDTLCATCHKLSFCADCHTNRIEFKHSL